MKASRLFHVALASLVVIGFSIPQGASACAACFGISDSPLAKGMNWGILSLLVIVLGVLAGIATAGIYFVRRASRNPLPVPSHPDPEFTEHA